MPTYQDILARLIDQLAPYAGDGQAIHADTVLVGDLGLDSVQVMEVLLQIEEHFDVSIPLNIMPEVRTVDDLAVQLQRIIDPPA